MINGNNIKPKVQAMKVIPIIAIITFWCFLKNSIILPLYILYFTIKNFQVQEFETYFNQIDRKMNFFILQSL